MAGISDIGTRLSQQYLLSILQDKMNETQRQATTGKKSETINGLGPNGASVSVRLHAQTALLDTYTSNLNSAKTRLSVMDQSFSSITSSTTDMLATLREQLQDTTPKASIVSDAAKNALQNVLAQLNSQFNGRYLFAGDDTSNAPANNAAALNTSMSTLVAGWIAGTPSAPTAASVASAARGVVGTALGFSSTSLAAGSITVRGDDNVDVDLTVKANQSGFSDIVRGLSIIANLPQPTTAAEQTNYWAVVNGAISLLDGGNTAVTQTQGVMGGRANTVNALLTQHSQTQGAYEDFIGDVEDVDMADAATRLQSLQTQLQASYSVIGQTKNLSLVNYL